jgi:dihydrodipicolinate synthase/N-acetylneuraminate lyase
VNKYRAFARTIRGPLVPLLTAFDDEERLDIDSTCRWVDWLLANGHKLFWTTYGTSHFMSLTDREVMELTEALAKVIAGRGIFIASVPRQWATNQCIEFVHFAARSGAHVVKLQLDWNFTPSDEQVLQHYRRIAEASPLPLFAYTLGPSGVTSALLRRIIEIPQFIGMKNDSDNFYGQERYLWTVRQYGDPEEFLVMTGGGLSSVALAYDLGVKAYGDTTPWFAPALSLRLYDCFQRGDRALVNRFLAEIEAPLFFHHWPSIGNNSGTWGWGHAIAYHLGLFASHQMRFPAQTLTPEQVAEAKVFLDHIADWG